MIEEQVLSLPGNNESWNKPLVVHRKKAAQGKMHKKRALHSHSCSFPNLRTTTTAVVEKIELGDNYWVDASRSNPIKKNNEATLRAAILACSEAHAIELNLYTQEDLDNTLDSMASRAVGIPLGVLHGAQW